MTDPLSFVTELAADTGSLLLDYYQTPQTNARLKADHTVLTEADLAANKFITQRIRAAFPHDHILSEEEDMTYPGDAPATWVVDPLDGTSNFSLGVHYWGVSIARVVDGWPQVAGLCFPVFGETFTAERGKGAFINGQPLDLKQSVDQKPVSIFTCDSRLHRNYKVSLRIKARILGSAAYNFCGVAHGVSVLGFETTPHIWDIAGSWLVLEEAGGVIESWGQRPFPLRPGQDYRSISYPVLGATRTDLAKLAREKIKLR